MIIINKDSNSEILSEVVIISPSLIYPTIFLQDNLSRAVSATLSHTAVLSHCVSNALTSYPGTFTCDHYLKEVFSTAEKVKIFTGFFTSRLTLN